MTGLIQRAIAEIEKLTAVERDAVATRMLPELADEQAWSARFDPATHEQWTAWPKRCGGESPPLDRRKTWATLLWKQGVLLVRRSGS